MDAYPKVTAYLNGHADRLKSDDTLLAVILRVGVPGANVVETAGRIMNVPVVDHLILGLPSNGHSGYFSLAASGLVEF